MRARIQLLAQILAQPFGKFLTVAITLAVATFPSRAAKAAQEGVIYSVYSPIHLGNPGEVAVKDFYVNLGTVNGIKPGTLLRVERKLSTYDVTSEKLYKDIVFTIGYLKVIHAESTASVGRLERMLPIDKTPAYSPHVLMIGDRVSNSSEN